jgi:hypothetical protein
MSIEVDQNIKLIEVVPIEEARFEIPTLEFKCPYCPAHKKDHMWHSPSPAGITWDENDEAYVRKYCTKCEKYFFIRLKRVPGKVFKKVPKTVDQWVPV